MCETSKTPTATHLMVVLLGMGLLLLFSALPAEGRVVIGLLCCLAAGILGFFYRQQKVGKICLWITTGLALFCVIKFAMVSYLIMNQKTPSPEQYMAPKLQKTGP